MSVSAVAEAVGMGNYAYFSFIIDRTENYFKLNEEYASNTSKTYGDNVNYSVEDYKTFKLDKANVQNEAIANLIGLAATNKLQQFEKYYLGANNNATMLANYFQKVGEEYYFTVKQNEILLHATAWINCESFTLSERNPSQKVTYYMSLFM